MSWLKRSLILCLGALALSSGLEAAPVPFAPGSILLTRTSQSPDFAACSDRSGGATIAWTEQSSSSKTIIYAEAISDNGKSRWQDGVVVDEFPSNKRGLAMVCFEDGSAQVAWSDDRNGSWHLWSQRLNPRGGQVWRPAGLKVASLLSDQVGTQIVPDPENGAIIIWQDMTASGLLVARRIGPRAEFWWGRESIDLAPSTYQQTFPMAVSDRHGGAFVLWRNTGNGYTDVAAQWMDGDAQRLWANGSSVCTEGEGETPHALLHSAQGSTIAIWQDARSGHSDFYGQRLAPNGDTEWPTIGIPLIEERRGQSNPGFDMDEQGGLWMVWEERDEKAGYWRVQTQYVDAGGRPRWIDEGLRVSDEHADQRLPAVVATAPGEAMILWFDNRRGKWDLFGQRLRNPRQRLWEENGLWIAEGESVEKRPMLLPSAGAGVVMVWSERLSRDRWAIRTQRISTQGKPLWESAEPPQLSS